jgi:hypothetical protein
MSWSFSFKGVQKEEGHKFGPLCKCGHHKDWHGDRATPFPCGASGCMCFGWKSKRLMVGEGGYVERDRGQYEPVPSALARAMMAPAPRREDYEVEARLEQDENGDYRLRMD